MLELLFWVVLAYLLADFFTGIYHWVKDTYFGPYTPIIGKNFVWLSRLHHVRPRHVLEFSDWELFWNSGSWTLLWAGPLFYLTGFTPFNVTLFLVIALNDVIHKYSHMKDPERPGWATFMQKIYIFQSHDEHHLHHIHPHDVNYCPITPYINVILENINFWRKIEKVIENFTGVKPRAREYDFVEDPKYPAGVRFLP